MNVLEFTLNGVEYTADGSYTSVRGVPVPIAYVHCTRVDREVNADGVEKKRKDILWFLHKYWVIPIALLGMQVGGLYRYYLFHYNEKVN